MILVHYNLYHSHYTTKLIYDWYCISRNLPNKLFYYQINYISTQLNITLHSYKVAITLLMMLSFYLVNLLLFIKKYIFVSILTKNKLLLMHLIKKEFSYIGLRIVSSRQKLIMRDSKWLYKEEPYLQRVLGKRWWF